MSQIQTKFLEDSAVSTAKINNDAVDKDKIAANVAGVGLGQNVDGSLEVNVDGSTLEINTDALRVKALGINESHLSSNIDDQTFVATHTAVNFTPVQVGSEGSTKLSAYIKGIDVALGTALAGANPSWGKQSLTLIAGDITAQYIDLAQQALSNSVSLSIEGVMQYEGVDYSLSVVSSKTRITFLSDLATAGASTLIAGDILRVQYQY